MKPFTSIALSAATVAAAPTYWMARHCLSPAVRTWTPPSLAPDTKGALFARLGGDGDRAVVLLHGLVSSGDVFGATYDELTTTHRLVVPDLLGFGRSMDASRSAFSIDDHLDALDQLADRTGLFERRWTIGAHSMGSALALRWAARHADRVDRVVCWGAPVYPSPDAALARVSGSAMARLFVLDTGWAEQACAVSCRHRSAAGWLTAASEPTLPVHIARSVALHTWPAYRDAMRHFVIEADWQDHLTRLDDSGVSVELVWGTNDKVGDSDFASTLTSASVNTTVKLVPGADHHLPLTHPELCRDHLDPET
jgi:pimeloyl-ACP methyl ester carboxylesterase